VVTMRLHADTMVVTSGGNLGNTTATPCTSTRSNGAVVVCLEVDLGALGVSSTLCCSGHHLGKLKETARRPSKVGAREGLGRNAVVSTRQRGFRARS